MAIRPPPTRSASPKASLRSNWREAIWSRASRRVRRASTSPAAGPAVERVGNDVLDDLSIVARELAEHGVAGALARPVHLGHASPIDHPAGAERPEGLLIPDGRPDVVGK